MPSSSPEDDPNMVWERFDPRDERHIIAIIDRQVERIRDELRGTLSPCEQSLADANVHRLRAIVERQVRADCAQLANAMRESEARDAITRH